MSIQTFRLLDNSICSISDAEQKLYILIEKYPELENSLYLSLHYWRKNVNFLLVQSNTELKVFEDTLISDLKILKESYKSVIKILQENITNQKFESQKLETENVLLNPEEIVLEFNGNTVQEIDETLSQENQILQEDFEFEFENPSKIPRLE